MANKTRVVKIKDLVVLDVHPQNEREFKKIMSADWFEPEGHPNVILVRFQDIGGLTETDPLDAGVKLWKTKLYRIPFSLKRYSEEDGWYHA